MFRATPTGEKKRRRLGGKVKGATRDNIKGATGGEKKRRRLGEKRTGGDWERKIKEATGREK